MVVFTVVLVLGGIVWVWVSMGWVYWLAEVVSVVWVLVFL